MSQPNKVKKQPNLDYMIESLSAQLSDANIKIATRDAVIAEQYEEIESLKQELSNYQKEQIKEMDKDAE